MATTGPIDVEAVLLNARSIRRKPGHIPYPLQYCSDVSNLDNWNQMFLQLSCKRLTLYQFDSPPSNVLDLGCGGGYWILNAAQQWKSTSFTGFDLHARQPGPDALRRHSENLADRVKWVHGNLLERLAFPSGQFDYVRIVGLGLGIPEDEWQGVLEEIFRVMTPGAVLEIIEEDLIFPWSPPHVSLAKRLPPISVNVPVVESPSSTSSIRSASTLVSDSWPLEFTDSSSVLSSGSMFSNTTITSSNTGFSSTLSKKPSLGPLPEEFGFSQFIIKPPTSFLNVEPEPDLMGESHPQDHSRLSSCWDAMLASRFLAPNVITILPFYLSSCYSEVQSHAPFHIALPQGSHTSDSTDISDEQPDTTFDPESQFKLSLFNGRSSSDNEKISPHKANATATLCHRMHLAKTVATVTACKEPMWQEYKTLFASVKLPRVSNTARVTSRSLKEPSIRDAFEKDWTAWENDMADRMNMRDVVTRELQWAEPAGERPNYHAWATNGDASRDSLPRSSGSPALSRSIRGFVARKPLTNVS